jgi:hypothetical protein
MKSTVGSLIDMKGGNGYLLEASSRVIFVRL